MQQYVKSSGKKKQYVKSLDQLTDLSVECGTRPYLVSRGTSPRVFFKTSLLLVRKESISVDILYLFVGKVVPTTSLVCLDILH